MIVPGSQFPEFKTNACVSVKTGAEFRSLGSSDVRGKWLVFYTYPKDFTFVCPTEIMAFDAKLAEFEKRGAVVLAASTDNEYSHLAWRQADAQLQTISHPMLFLSAAFGQALGVLHPVDGVAVRATFIVDPDNVVRFASANDLDVGRNVDEVLRVLDGLQTGELVGCNWKPGDKMLSQRKAAS